MSLVRIQELVECSKLDATIIVGSDIREVAAYAFAQRKIAQTAVHILESNRHMLNAQQLAQVTELKALL